MALSLRRRILWWSVTSTLVIVLAAFLLVDGIIRSTIDRNQRENLVAGARLASQIQAAEVDVLIDRTASLASAPTLRAAVETGDSSTIRENLDVLLASSGTAWLAVTTPDGEPIAATEGAPQEIATAAALVQSARYFNSAELWHRDGWLQQVHASGVFFGSSQLGVLLSGVPIGAQRVRALEEATRQRIAFIADGRAVATDTAMDEAERGELAAAWARPAAGDATAVGDATAAGRAESERAEGDGADDVRDFDLAGERHIGTALDLPDGRGGTAGQLVTFRSLEAAMQPARVVRYALLGIAAVGLVLALAASYLLARRVTTPVNRLLQETVRLGSGDLDRPVTPGRDDEIGRLALGFEQMRQSLKRAQDELVRAERLSAVGRAASAIVHDIRQPVSVIQGNVELLRDDWDDEARRTEDMSAINHELDRLNGMMGEILDFARGSDAVQMSTGSVPELLDEVARATRTAARDSGVTVTAEHGYDGTWRLDFARTRRVLENLARNAVAAQRGRGSVALRSSRTDRGLRIEVEDDGPGIPEQVREDLFEPFVTFGKEGGTGLGLAIVKAFTERQGGSVQYETSPAGTRFILDFPEGAVG